MSRISISALTAAALLLAPAVRPQSASVATAPPRFDAASVKRLAPGTPAPRFDSATYAEPRQHGRYTDRYTSLKGLLTSAYHLPPERVSGPAWMDSEHYSIAAIMPPETPDDKVLVILQNLLKERFQLKLHLEDRETAVYVLMVGKDGPKLNKAGEGQGPLGHARQRPSGWEFTNGTMEMVAGFLSRSVDRPVIDKTGLSGAYDLTLDWSRYQIPPAAGQAKPDDGMPIHPMEAMRASTDPAAILRSLASVGLRAEARKVPLKYLFVDHAEKTPTEN